ncbi:MAG: CHASE2 domain-containing protein [bacterium]
MKQSIYFIKKALAPLSIILVFSICAILPLPWNEIVENIFLDLQFKIRGERDLSEDIVFVYIGAEDIKALGGWPVTRDYYGYLTHVLKSMNVKIIGIYLMFDAPDSRYPEYDQILDDFFKSANNICLPMAFYDLSNDTWNNQVSESKAVKIPKGRDPILPIEKFREHTAGIGFSNLGKEVIHHKAPLIAGYGERNLLSFGCELARLYLNASHDVRIKPNAIIFTKISENEVFIPIDQDGQLRLNHFGDIERVQAMGLVDLLQAYETSPDSLNLNGKLVIVDVTAPGIPTLEATPLASALPASLIHATVAENILKQNYLRELSAPILWLLISLLVMSAWLIWQTESKSLMIGGSVGVLTLYWISTMILFSRVNLIIPLLYPTFSYIATISLSAFLRSQQRRSQEDIVKSMLEEQIANKETQLFEAKTKLEELQNQLLSESSVSEQITNLAEERRQAIIALEKQLDDLQAYTIPEKQRPKLQFSEIIHAEDSKMSHILALVSKVGSDDIPVLILGETGTGKEMIANAIHQSQCACDSRNE